MARQITVESCNAFMSARKMSKQNMLVIVEDNVVKMYLHGNLIARREVGSNDLQITNAGWFSTTTKERLSGLPGVSVCQKKGVWFLNGNEWNGKWVTV